MISDIFIVIFSKYDMLSMRNKPPSNGKSFELRSRLKFEKERRENGKAEGEKKRNLKGR
jgi:hypothetical protein